MNAALNPFAGLMAQCIDSRAQNIIEWRLRGLNEREIAVRVKCSGTLVHRTLVAYGINGVVWFDSQKILMRNAEFAGWLGLDNRIYDDAPDIDDATAVYTVKVRKL